MPNASRIILGILLLAALTLVAETAAAQKARIYVTNSAGDNIHVIDPATNKVVQVIEGIEAAHGIDFSPDGSRVYVSNESDATLDVFDAGSGTPREQGEAVRPSEQHRRHQGRRARGGRDRARSRARST